MTTEVSYRAAATSDIDCLLQLMLGLQQDDPWSVPFREEVVRESLRELLINPSVGRVFLICDADSCVGYVVLSFDFSLEYGGRNAWIDELFIRPELRGKGIGSKALDFAVQVARECGAKVLHLEVNRGNPAINSIGGTASKTTTAPCSRSGLPERTRRITNDHVNQPRVMSEAPRHRCIANVAPVLNHVPFTELA
jgi:GNAT superfamily N-acetyltransferase